MLLQPFLPQKLLFPHCPGPSQVPSSPLSLFIVVAQSLYCNQLQTHTAGTGPLCSLPPDAQIHVHLSRVRQPNHLPTFLLPLLFFDQSSWAGVFSTEPFRNVIVPLLLLIGFLFHVSFLGSYDYDPCITVTCVFPPVNPHPS